MPDDVKLLSVIDAYADNAYGSDADDGELARQRALALDAYAGKNIEPAPEGRSQVVDWTGFETVQWIIPSLMRIFAGGDDIVEFDPFGPEDEDAAEQESKFLNYLVTQKNKWFKTCLTWFQDALITKNAYCMAFMEEKLRTEIEVYEGQSEEQVAMILDGDVEVIGQQAYPDPNHEPEPITDPETGEPMVDLETGELAFTDPQTLFDVQVRMTQPRKRLAFKVLPPERCLVDSSCTDYTLDGCDYFEYWDNVTISDLRAMGYPVEDDAGDDEDYDTPEDDSRDEIFGDNRANIPDPASRKVKARWVWVRHDYDEDGIAELQHVVLVGRDIVDHQPVNTIPVSSLVPSINTHRHIGVSVLDLVFDIQRIKTALLRQGLDNLYLANNPREFASNKVNMDDLLVSKPGQKVRVDTDAPDVAGHAFTAPYPNIFPQAQDGLGYMDSVVEARVGVNRIFQGIDNSTLNEHNRIGQLSTMAAQRVEMIARIFGDGIERLFQIAHELIIKAGAQGETMKLTGEYVQIDPTQWKTGRDMRVVAPYAAGNKDSLLQRLMIIGDVHREAIAGAHPMVQADDTYEWAKELSRAADLPDWKFFTDPATIPPPEPQPDPTLIALEIEGQKADNQLQIKEMDNAADLQKTQIQADTDRFEAELRAEVDLIVAGLKDQGVKDVETLRQKFKTQPVADVNTNVDGVRQLVQEIADATQSLSGAVDELKAIQNAPIEIVRDENGRITGKRVNGQFVPLQDAS